MKMNRHIKEKDSRLEKYARQEIVEWNVNQICICVNKKDYDDCRQQAGKVC